MLFFPSWHEFKNFAVDVGLVSSNHLRTDISTSSSLKQNVGDRRFHSSGEVEMVGCDSECKIPICTVTELLNSCRYWTSASCIWGLCWQIQWLLVQRRGRNGAVQFLTGKIGLRGWERVWSPSAHKHTFRHSTCTVLGRPLLPAAPCMRLHL